MQAARSADEGHVTIFARLLPSPARRSPIGTRGRAFILALLVSAAAMAATAASAGALVVSGVGSVTVGAAPRYSAAYEAGGAPKTFANLSGNPVLHGTKEYAVFWDPTDSYHGDWEAAVESYMQRAAAQSEYLTDSFAADSGYTDKSNRPAGTQQTFMGAYSDYRPYPSVGDCTDPEPFEPGDQIGLEFGGSATAVCLTSTEMAEALKAFIAEHNLPKGLGYSYFLLTPPGVTVCLDGGTETGHCSDYKKSSVGSKANSFCSYHSDYNPGGLETGDGNTIVYAVIPWTAAGGYGDWGLAASDQRPGWECQDGGWYAGPKGREREHAKERTKQTQEAFENTMNAEEKAKLLLQEELEGPHEEEPNQQACTTEDGYCDYGLADLIVNQISLQQQDMVTDPLLNSWKDNNEYEVADECRFRFGPELGGALLASEETRAGTLSNQSLAGFSYYLNDTYWPGGGLSFPNGKNGACWHGIALVPNFTAPSPVNSGETVGFDGMGSDIALDAGTKYSAGGSPEPTYATYTWNFGDGTPTVSGYAPGSPECALPWLSPCAASVFHSYQYGGKYIAILTVKDVGGNVSRTEHEVVVNGPPPPSPAVPPAFAGAAGQAAGAGAPAGAGGAAVTPSPVAAAAIVSRTLKNALHSGLVVRYSVSEQVAGHFEVLLSRAIARRLGIGGAPAVGLPAGTAPQVVIAKAILVTTAAGRSSIKIQFSKHTAARLGRLHKVSLMLRLIVRNAASHNPATTTVVSNITLD